MSSSDFLENNGQSWQDGNMVWIKGLSRFIFLGLIVGSLVACGPVTFEQPIAVFDDPKDPSLPELIVSGDHGFHLDPAWQVATIEYVYSAGTASSSGYEKIEPKDSDYVWNGQKISRKVIENLLANLTDLHPVPTLIGGFFSSSPPHQQELDLTGTDGNHILLSTGSNENSGYGPWNITYNGRIYAQYNGSLIANAVGALFNNTGVSFSWKGSSSHPASMVGFDTTSDWLNQLYYGFVGFLPIAKNLTFDELDFSTQHELVGRVNDEFPVLKSEIDGLLSVDLVVRDQKISCAIADKARNQLDYADEWKFSCPLPSIEGVSRNEYSIYIVIHTKDGKQISTSGKLQTPFALIDGGKLPSEEIQAAIAQNAAAQDLLRDHIFDKIQYKGKLELGQDQFPTLLGQISLRGQARVKEISFPYTVTVPFALLDGKFVEWGLTRQELQQLILDAFGSPVVVNMYKKAPDTTLRLWYVTQGNLGAFPELPLPSSGVTSYFAISLPACGKIPGIALPTAERPLRAFGFGSVDFSRSTNFILTQKDVVPYRMALFPEDSKDASTPYLLPNELKLEDGRVPFESITNGGFENVERMIRLRPSQEMLFEAYEIVDSMNFRKEQEGRSWIMRSAGIAINEDGSLSLVSCSAK